MSKKLPMYASASKVQTAQPMQPCTESPTFKWAVNEIICVQDTRLTHKEQQARLVVEMQEEMLSRVCTYVYK